MVIHATKTDEYSDSALPSKIGSEIKRKGPARSYFDKK
jgi:hypothetical protein